MGSGSTRTDEQAAAAIRACETQWEEKGYGLVAVELLDSSGLIGFAGVADLAAQRISSPGDSRPRAVVSRQMSSAESPHFENE